MHLKYQVLTINIFIYYLLQDVLLQMSDVLSEQKEKLFHCKDDQALAQVAWRDLHPWRYSKALWPRSWAISSRCLCLSRGWMTYRGPFQPQPSCHYTKSYKFCKAATRSLAGKLLFTACLKQLTNCLCMGFIPRFLYFNKWRQ